MADYVPNISEAAYDVGDEVTPQVLLQWDPYPQYVTDAELAAGGGGGGGAVTPDATPITKGKIRIAGDIGGTADEPTVIGTHLTSPMPVTQGGTGSSTKIFVDNVTSETVGGSKTFTGTTTLAALRLPNGLPGVGKVLISDAQGNASWGDVSTSGTVQDATPVIKGIVQLAGDLGGTANDPTVTATHLTAPLPVAQGGTGSNTKTWVDTTTAQTVAGDKVLTGVTTTATLYTTTLRVTGGTPGVGKVLTSDGIGNATWQTPTGGSGSVADATTSAKGVIQLAGDLAGTAAAPTVPGMVKTTTDQTIAGIKTFSSPPKVPNAAVDADALSYGYAKTKFAQADRTMTLFIDADGDLAVSY